MAADFWNLVHELGSNSVVAKNIGCRQAFDYANPRFGIDFAGRTLSLYALKHARGHPPGLYPRGPSQRVEFVARLRNPCLAKCPDSADYAIWPYAPGPHRWW